MHAHDYASEAKDIFVLPDAVFQIKRLIDDHAASMEEISNIINFDPALTVQILKIANSALYKFPNQVDSISKATQIIGTNSVYDLVVAFGVRRAFEEVATTVIDLERFWENAVFCGLLNKYFAERLLGKNTERLFVAGLLHNVGELIMVRFNPQIAKKCAQINEAQTPLSLQLNHIGSTYADIGASLIKMWGIPDSISTPIKHQHYEQSESANIEDKIMQLSYIMALDHCNPEIYSGHANLEVELYETLGLDNDDLQAALTHTGMQSLSVLAMFSPASVSVL
ncbi:HDOD domain-containing protein [Aliiglaciecola sp. LCG003]|uniref:HDOD domain-containing protein n=1 Tax=Aliiglaciecola sp. LCG003 TaxID=3053655 RepID=UPI0025743C82|nr:HDOD domain-containing protein [Aliiglaciecola sp. LCG003]WJG07922.1 HDOD domain-containing protein [Aliiglaciecola sp. LCG003]